MPNLDFSKAEFFSEKIMVLNDVLTEEECNLIIDRHKNLDNDIPDEDNLVIRKLEPWNTSSYGSAHVYGTKRESQSSGERLANTKDYPTIMEYYRWIKGIFYEAGKYYHEQLGIPYEDGKHWSDFATFHYLNGQEMGPHVDYNGEPDLAPIATGLLYLNNDKTGGDLNFREQEVFVKSSAGTLVIFPCVAPFYHESTLITEGEKYHIGTAWKRSNNRH